MNHHYPENYHGYVRGAAGMQNMGYGHGVYEEQMSMGHMGHSRTNYQMSQYRDSGQMHPMMQQQQNNIYPSGGYMNQVGGGSYGMGAYPNYGMTNQANMMMGPRGNVMGRYYNHPMDSRTNQHTPTASPNSSYSQSPVGSSLHCQSPMNRMPTSQNCPQSPAGPMQGSQSSHCASPHTMSSAHSNNGFQGQGSSVNHSLMSGVQGQQRPVAGNMSGSGVHQIPQHPMRHPTTQQNPQEVADNILQIASSYPSNQTVQVPLKSRHAPYHIPRSPHYSMSSSDHSHSSPMASHSQQPSPGPQPSPSPTTSSVKSPTPSLAPIPNPIPSPGITGLRSPSSQGAVACGSRRSPAHMASSYSGHSQPSPSSHHYSPTGMGSQQNFSPFAHSPTASRVMPASYPPANDPNVYSNSDVQDSNPFYSSPLPSSASPHSHSVMPPETPPSNAQFNQGKGNNPLMSLQKLVMLPETQVIDPKSVVNDACLSSQSIENEEVPKNVEDPAEGCAESSYSSVGCPGQSSSLSLQSAEQTQVCTELKSSDLNTSTTEATADNPAVIENTDFEEKDSNVSLEATEKGAEIVMSNCQKEKHEAHSETQPPISTLDQRNGDISNKETMSVEENDSETSNVSELKISSQELKEPLENLTEITDKRKNLSPESNDIISEVKSESERDMSNFDGKLDEQQTDNVLHSLKRKNGKVNGLSEDVKLPLQCRSPGVLSEVPLLVNGMSASENVDDTVDQDNGEDVNKKLQNGFTSRLRSKLRIGEKGGQFIRLTTPCSIAVGADERAMCERFVFRRNEYCHTLRTSRLLCNGRTRQDSTGNGDSDESIENVSDGTFHMIDNPQDGCKKKYTSASTKKSDIKRSTINNSTRVAKKDGVVSNKEGQVCKASNGHVSNSNEHNVEASDEDGEVCYYEGVDSSDFFMNNVSSDDSISLSHEGRQTSPLNSSTSACGNHQNLVSNSETNKTSQEKEQGNINDDISSPPQKRTRISSEQNMQEPLNKKYYPSKCTSNSSNKESDNTSDDSGKSDTIKLDLNQKSSQTNYQENGKICRTRFSKRKSPAVKEKQSPSEQHKLPEVVVRLEKSPIVEENTSLKLELMENSSLAKLEKFSPISMSNSSPEKVENLCTKSITVHKSGPDMSIVKEEDQLSVQEDIVSKPSNNAKDDNVIKSEVPDLGEVSCSMSTPSKAHSKRKLTSRKKKPMKKGKKHVPPHGNMGKNDEVKNSFKSMKFSRTLDMMKCQKKRDSCYTGPFIRIEGGRNAPNTVSVFNQSSQDLIPIANRNKHNQRQSLSRNVNTTVHMVSNLANDKTVMVSSTKVLPNKQWSCAFCSYHSSFRSLGDLFGPYFKEADLPVLENITLEESKKVYSIKDSPKSANISTPKQSKASPSDKKGSRKRKSSVKSEQYIPQEIWLHESCALWAPGVYLIGNRIYGLDDAIRDTAETICLLCKGKGAMIGCLYKGCAMKYHFACAIEKDCHLDEGNFSLLCPKHKDKKWNIASSSSYSTQKNL